MEGSKHYSQHKHPQEDTSLPLSTLWFTQQCLQVFFSFFTFCLLKVIFFSHLCTSFMFSTMFQIQFCQKISQITGSKKDFRKSPMNKTVRVSNIFLYMQYTLLGLQQTGACPPGTYNKKHSCWLLVIGSVVWCNPQVPTTLGLVPD